MTIQELMAMLQGQTAQPSTVRPDYGLTGAMISPQRSPYERTMAPGEQRSAGDLQDMLAEVIMAAGSMAVPGVGGNGGSSMNAAASPSSRRSARRSILAGGDRPAPSGSTGGILSYIDSKTGKVQYVDARDIKGQADGSILAGGKRPAPSAQTGGIISIWDPVAGKVIYVDARDLP